MGNVSVKQHKSRQIKTKRNKCKTNKHNNTKNKKRRGGQGSPLNPTKEKSSLSSGTKKRKVNKDNKTLYSILQKHKARNAYLKEKRRQQIASQKENFLSGSTQKSSSSVKRKSI